jgi:hypothetical protein
MESDNDVMLKNVFLSCNITYRVIQNLVQYLKRLFARSFGAENVNKDAPEDISGRHEMKLGPVVNMSTAEGLYQV